MAKIRHGLGRGLDALLENPEPLAAEQASGNPAEPPDGSAVIMVDPALLQPNPRQPRKEFDGESLQDLAASIREHGIIQPVIAEEAGDGRYFLIAGERRTRAARLAGLKEIPVLVRKFSDERKLEVALIENIQREDLNPVDEAEAYHALMLLENLSQEEAAARVGKSRPAVANALRLLKLPADMREALKNGKITPGHARALLSVVNPADQQILFGRILGSGLSVRESEAWAAELNGGGRAAPPSGKKKKTAPPAADADLLAVQEKLIECLGTKVAIKGSADRGVLEISYFSAGDLDRLYERFTGNQ